MSAAKLGDFDFTNVGTVNRTVEPNDLRPSCHVHFAMVNVFCQDAAIAFVKYADFEDGQNFVLQGT